MFIDNYHDMSSQTENKINQPTNRWMDKQMMPNPTMNTTRSEQDRWTMKYAENEWI